MVCVEVVDRWDLSLILAQSAWQTTIWVMLFVVGLSSGGPPSITDQRSAASQRSVKMSAFAYCGLVSTAFALVGLAAV